MVIPKLYGETYCFAHAICRNSLIQFFLLMLIIFIIFRKKKNLTGQIWLGKVRENKHICCVKQRTQYKREQIQIKHNINEQIKVEIKQN